MQHFVQARDTGLWLVDVQEKLFSHIYQSNTLLAKLIFALRAARELQLPLIVTEQYPQGLGPTLSELKKNLPQDQSILPKSSFSGYLDPDVKKHVDALQLSNWILVGIESHICLLQTAKDLILEGAKNVVVLSDAIGARNLSDHLSALEEMRMLKIRVTTSETIFYEMLRDAKNPHFKNFLSSLKVI